MQDSEGKTPLHGAWGNKLLGLDLRNLLSLPIQEECKSSLSKSQQLRLYNGEDGSHILLFVFLLKESPCIFLIQEKNCLTTVILEEGKKKHLLKQIVTEKGDTLYIVPIELDLILQELTPLIRGNLGYKVIGIKDLFRVISGTTQSDFPPIQPKLQELIKIFFTKALKTITNRLVISETEFSALLGSENSPLSEVCNGEKNTSNSSSESVAKLEGASQTVPTILDTKHKSSSLVGTALNLEATPTISPTDNKNYHPFGGGSADDECTIQ